MTERVLPEMGQALPANHATEGFRDALWWRRSTLADQLAEPGPDPKILDEMLTIAARVPDHGRVVPFRFLRITGDARSRAGAELRRVYADKNPEANDTALAREEARFIRAPVVICVIARLNPEHRIPVWEQTMTCGAVCQNLLLAASAYGFAAQWLSEWYAYDRDVLTWLGLAPEEQVAGYVYIGSTEAAPKERARPDLAAITSDLA